MEKIKSNKDKPHTSSASVVEGGDVRSFYEGVVGLTLMSANDMPRKEETSSELKPGTSQITPEKSQSISESSTKKCAVADVKADCINRSKHENQANPGRVNQTEGDDRERKALSQRDIDHFLRCAQEGDNDGILCYSELGMHVDVCDQYGWTALMCAAQAGRCRTVCVLLEKGADHTRHNNQGQSARDIAKKARHYAVIAEIDAVVEGAVNDSDDDITLAHSAPFYCDICKSKFHESTEDNHKTSTLHLFNCGLAPKPTNYFLAENNRGFQMMLRSGWNQETGLGPEGQGQKFPVKTVLKRDRHGLGCEVKSSPRVTHFSALDSEAVKQDPETRVMRGSTINKKQRASKA